MANMGFAEAKRIRGESLSNRIANRLVGGESFGSSISKSLSEGTKARITGLKEKINPMNIARFMTGGSPLAAAVVGRMFGASKEDMRYFAGKQGKTDTASKIKPTPTDEGVLDLLNEIYLLLEDSRRSNLKEFPTEEEIFEREKRARDRHNDLLKALEYKKPKEDTATKEKEDESLLKSILGWFKSPVGLWLLGLGGMAALFGSLYFGLKMLAEVTPNMKALSPQEAQNVLENASERDIEAAGGRQKLEDIIKNGKQRAIDALAMPENTEEEQKAKAKVIRDMGGFAKVLKIADDETEYSIPAGSADPKTALDAPDLPNKVTPKSEFKVRNKTKAASAEIWDQRYGSKYNEDGTRKTATPQAMPEIPKEDTNQKSLSVTPEASIPPQESTPSTAKINDVIRENVELNLPSAATVANQTVNNTNVNTESQVALSVTDVPAVRNTEETFRRMILYSTRVV